MSGHGHSHGCGECDHGEEDKVAVMDAISRYSLFKYIDLQNLQCLNEETPDSGKLVFRSYEERLDPDKFVTSDADEELLFNIPFTGHIKLTGIIISSDDDDSHPKTIALFKNKSYMTFDAAQGEPEQEIELAKDPTATIEYPVKASKFNSVYHLSIHVRGNYGAEATRIRYIGLKGEYSEAPRQGILVTNYELSANPADHKADFARNVNHEIS